MLIYIEAHPGSQLAAVPAQYARATLSGHSPEQELALPRPRITRRSVVHRLRADQALCTLLTMTTRKIYKRKLPKR